MGIKKVVVFFTAFTLLGCSSNSNISVNICNQSGIDKTDITQLSHINPSSFCV